MDSLSFPIAQLSSQDYSGPEAGRERKSVMVEETTVSAKREKRPFLLANEVADVVDEAIYHDLGGGAAFFTPYVSFSQEKNTEDSSL